VEEAIEGTQVLGARLRMQGYAVDIVANAAEGARQALANPPALVIADLWMPGISGVQMCRLLKAEAATRHVPVILRGPDEPRNRFWAERAGAAAYIIKGRMGDLVRAMAKAIEQTPPSDDFFTELSTEGADIRDRIAAHLDAALFESVIASEVRALSLCGAFDRLFDLLSQIVSQVTNYRWLALSTPRPERLGLHTHPKSREICEAEARKALHSTENVFCIPVEDEDAFPGIEGPAPLVEEITLGDTIIGHLAMAPCMPQHESDPQLIAILARELAGPIRVATLVEETQRLATVDSLTGLMNRRALIASLNTEIARSRRMSYPLAFVLFDIDYFKIINDRRGHACGDQVLAAMGKLLHRTTRKVDLLGRWGGEEFVVAFCGSDESASKVATERIRAEVEALEILDTNKEKIPVTASFGLTQLLPEDTLDTLVDRADRSMYEAKAHGRNRVIWLGSSGSETVSAGPSPADHSPRASPDNPKSADPA
jgi:two-component system cell cycle response regulator